MLILLTDRLVHLLEKMDPDCPERIAYISHSIKWSSSSDISHKRGHPDLHQKFGVIFWHG